MTGQGKCAIDTLLAESFKELAKKHPIEKITIKEITDLAGVIRPTFYNHFQDKYELLEWIITTDLLDPIEPLIQNGMISEGLVLLFTNIEKDSEFYSRAIKLEGQNSFGEIAQIGKTLLERAQGGVVHLAVQLLAVAGDEGDGVALVDQLDRSFYLPALYLKFLSELI